MSRSVKTPIVLLVLAAFPSFASERPPSQTIRVFPGYITKLTCEGKLLVSSGGNDSLMRVEALPSALGCAVLLKPLTNSGRTNLVLETSAGSIQLIIEVKSGSPSARELKIALSGDRA